MNSYLMRFIKNRIEEAGDFVCGHMPIDLPPEQVYADLFSGIVGGESILRAFRAASKHLAPGVVAKRVPVQMNGVCLTFLLRLPPTDVDSTYFIPVEGFAIHSESKLALALKLPLQIARQWMMLKEAFDQLADVTDTAQIAMLMPWLRDMVDQNTVGAIGGLKRERTKIDNDVKIITRGYVPNKFPRLTSQLNLVCLSGKALFTQYRLLETTIDDPSVTLPPIAATRTDNLLPKWFREHIEEVVGDWTYNNMNRK